MPTTYFVDTSPALPASPPPPLLPSTTTSAHTPTHPPTSASSHQNLGTTAVLVRTQPTWRPGHFAAGEPPFSPETHHPPPLSSLLRTTTTPTLTRQLYTTLKSFSHRITFSPSVYTCSSPVPLIFLEQPPLPRLRVQSPRGIATHPPCRLLLIRPDHSGGHYYCTATHRSTSGTRITLVDSHEPPPTDPNKTLTANLQIIAVTSDRFRSILFHSDRWMVTNLRQPIHFDAQSLSLTAPSILPVASQARPGTRVSSYLCRREA